MEVTRKNFKEVLPLVRDSIQAADFLAIDTEFTGLMSGRDVSMFDSPPEYYATLLNGTADFLLIQFGLCTFYWDEKEKQYMNDAYNFYVFPRGRPGPDRLFMCQSSSLDFLASQDFDFNKLIREGISYMTEPTEAKLREELTEKQKKSANEKDCIPIPEEHKVQIDNICKKVRHFIDFENEDEMEIDRCNAFIRRLLFQELGKRFHNEVFVESKMLENKNRVLKVSKIKCGSDRMNRDVQKKNEEWEQFEDAVGFSRVARMISQSGKLVIGHNMLLDVMHTLNHFFQPLPTDYNTFKEFTHCMFPRILDTKYMSSLPPMSDKVDSSVLTHLLATMSEAPFSVPKALCKPGRGYTLADDKQHEAGYDAYITGVCFLAMINHLVRMRGDQPARLPPLEAAIWKPFMNKLYLAKTAHQDSPYINLTGPDPTPTRDHVFHVTFPKEWKRSDISQLFSPFGQITVQFLNDTTAFIAFSRRDLARGVPRAFAGDRRVTIVPYVTYKIPKLSHSNQYQLDRREDDKYKKVYTHESSNATSPGYARKETQKSRERSNSVSSVPVARKRTSSGIFKIEDVCSPPKKIEKELANEDEKDLDDVKKIENSNNVSRVNVNVFKESDSWD
ncbi:poly(A)-specific ribonuclease PARN-like isoform X2 [Danaus plexippus]|uniref:poly(A)-specific ribonuclease PARN-like isoform X2 n=1 Tax=Danaus plexippus TaxID=13037 RepID=UPI002AB0C298|nr:poly(A)-specific ribonuclease PARN-like isoform X2 [Danaus plexippus]